MTIRITCKCSGCHKSYVNWASLQKHTNRCIKHMKAMLKKGYMTKEMYQVNVTYIKKMGYKQT